MFFAFLSARVRQYLLLAFLVPLVGRLLQRIGVRVGARNPRAGQLLTQAGSYVSRPLTREQRRLAARTLRKRRR